MKKKNFLFKPYFYYIKKTNFVDRQWCETSSQSEEFLKKKNSSIKLLNWNEGVFFSRYKWSGSSLIRTTKIQKKIKFKKVQVKRELDCNYG